MRSLAAFHRLYLLMKSSLLALLLAVCCPTLLFGWGQPHHAITRAALEALPGWQKELLGTELKALGDAHCMIPANVYSDKANAKYAAMDSRPGEVYLQLLHLPTVQTEYLEVMSYFMERAVTALREGRTGDAARFMGTMCHQIEDYGSPSHTMPGDNQFTLLQQFLPPSDGMKLDRPARCTPEVTSGTKRSLYAQSAPAGGFGRVVRRFSVQDTKRRCDEDVRAMMPGPIARSARTERRDGSSPLPLRSSEGICGSRLPSELETPRSEKLMR